MSLLHLNLVNIVLIGFTYYSVIRDRAFSRRGRRGFQLALLSCFILTVVSDLWINDTSKTLAYSLKLDIISIVIDAVSMGTCVYYYCRVNRTYKRDRLTGLMIRHNLNYEMEDHINQSYDIVLIDVDNFKLINDKYGHDRGDEVLVTIVNTTLRHLPKGCRMYRFGGDEFVIISTKVASEVLEEALSKANDELLEDDLRMSYGIVRHEPGTDSAVSLTAADKAMYENKRLLKSEDIWDDMTGLYNLRGFIDELDSFRKAVAKDEHMICLVGVDVERLSNINKAYGYGEGNLIITELAKCLKKSLRGRDFIGHLGSDEFVVAIECENNTDGYISSFIHQLNELMATSYELSEKEYSVRLNIDRAFIERKDTNSSEEHVDGLLYVKQENKDNRRKNDASEDKDYNNEEEALVLDILDNNKLQYAFQPIVSAKDGSIIAYESLMRSDTDVMISPLKILSYAAHCKRSYDVEKYSFFNTLEKFRSDNKIPDDVKIFINSIPGSFLTDIDFELLQSKFGSLTERMVIEITEQRDLDDDSLALLNSRREKAGFSLAIDDYGSGCSNTNNLLRYMPQIVKLDRLLITGIDRNAKKQFFVNSIISFAKENDMLTLAEGVETERELKTVVKLGVDMIQGYVAAKPNVEIIREIPENIKNIIVSENLKVGSNQRMTYTASDSCELSVVQLAMEDYSRLNVLTDIITVTGSSEYSADLTIKIKDNINCHMTLSDVTLNSVDDRPCIEIGENTNLTLNIEGSCRLNAIGIYVPESSSLTVIGNGWLKICAKGHECYAIGTTSQQAFGNISLKSSGLVELDVDGERCVGIGGGICGPNSAINVLSGTVKMVVAGVDAVGIGAYSGDVPIRVRDSELNVEFRVSSGTIMGTLEGKQDILVENYRIEMTGSGRDIAIFGCPSSANGELSFQAGHMKLEFSGHNIYFMGGAEGDVKVDVEHSNVSILGEGDNITGFGTRSEEATVILKESGIDLTINASSPQGIAAKEKEIKYIGPNKTARINGEEIEIEKY